MAKVRSIDVSGGRNQNFGNHHQTTNNYTGLSREDLVAMLEERFHHMQAKEVQMDGMLSQIEKFGDEIIRQNADFRAYNVAFGRQMKTIDYLKNIIAAQSKTIVKLTYKLLEKG